MNHSLIGMAVALGCIGGVSAAQAQPVRLVAEEAMVASPQLGYQSRRPVTH
jgi:hypothetical protein